MSVSDAVIKGLNSVKVSKRDAMEFERKLEGEIIDKWYESCEVMKTTKIPIENIDGFLDHMRKSYEGFDDKKRQEVGAVIADQTWNETVIEWGFDEPDNTVVRYGILVFGRSPDKKYVDCLYVLFKMDFKLASKERLAGGKGESPCSKPPSNVLSTPKKMSWSKESKEFQNFVRMKALEECCKEGLIEKIKYVHALEDHPDLSKDLNEQATENITDLSEKSSEKTLEETSNTDAGSSKQGSEDKPEVMESLSPQSTESTQMETDDLPKKEEK